MKNQQALGRHSQPFKFPKARATPYPPPLPDRTPAPWQTSDIDDAHRIPGVRAVEFDSPGPEVQSWPSPPSRGFPKQGLPPGGPHRGGFGPSRGHGSPRAESGFYNDGDGGQGSPTPPDSRRHEGRGSFPGPDLGSRPRPFDDPDVVGAPPDGYRTLENVEHCA